MNKIVGMLLLFAAAPVIALAGVAPVGPEINASSAVSAVALLSGSLLVLRGRRRK